jgi:AcrR family transcriptional regulator
VANNRTPREAWIDHGLTALARGGPDAVRVEVLAKELGVSKGGFYWHFADRQALLGELIDEWERRSVDQVIQLVESTDATARERLRLLFSIARLPEVRVDLFLRQWARTDKAVARRVKRIDGRRMDFMRLLFAEICDTSEEVEARCLLTMGMFIANPYLDVGHSAGDREAVVTAATEHLLS